ncbi:MAG: 50S ribosomal protein L21e [Candidatus Thermoplasmatota archaeon]|nr:50S ribosomal protein L21e [Candidatus Thermoplasmatota archaeon]
MGKMSHGSRAKTRYKMRKKLGESGPIPVNRLVKVFEVGDRVAIDIEPSYHNGMPFKRFQGKTGIIEEMRGSAYIVKLNDQNKEKLVISHPVHLKKA